MAYFKFALIALFFACNSAFAGYANLAPPPGWSQGLNAVHGQSGTFAFGPAANYSSFKGNTVLTNAALNVAGQLVTIPVSMRLAANAATVAAEWSFGNPYLFAAALAAPLAYKWYSDSGLSVENGAWVKRDPKTCTATSCKQFSACLSTVVGGNYCSDWLGTLQAAASSAASKASAEYAPYSYSAACSDGVCVYSYAGPNGSTGQVSGSHNYRNVPLYDNPPAPVGLPEFKTIIAPSPMPSGVPSELPAVPWPVGIPVFNPDPAITPMPAPEPAAVPRPLFVPTGNPVPTSDPNVWNQPGIRANPAPSPDSPWRVDLQPETIPQNSPTPKTPAELNPETPPVSQPVTGDKLGLCDQYPGIAACQPGGKPEDAVDFCKANPDVLACQKLDLDTPDVPELETKDIPIAITPSSGWGASNAACPAPRHLVGANVDMPFTMMCDFMSGIRPILIGIAWLSAAFILLGMKGGAD